MAGDVRAWHRAILTTPGGNVFLLLTLFAVIMWLKLLREGATEGWDTIPWHAWVFRGGMVLWPIAFAKDLLCGEQRDNPGCLPKVGAMLAMPFLAVGLSAGLYLSRKDSDPWRIALSVVMLLIFVLCIRQWFLRAKPSVGEERKEPFKIKISVGWWLFIFAMVACGLVTVLIARAHQMCGMLPA
jgi:uncharacterized membrane protein YadS